MKNLIHILGVPIHTLSLAQVIDALGNQKQMIFTPNPEIILQAQRDPEYKKILQKGTLLLPDGHGLFLISTLLKIRSKFLRLVVFPFTSLLFLFYKKPFKKIIPALIPGVDFMAVLIAWAESSGRSVFFLGAAPGVAQEAADYFCVKHPSLIIAGASSMDPGEASFKLVKESKAQVILVAYGSPKQEKWINEYAQKLPDAQIMIGIGGAFDFWSGKLKRAPYAIRKIGLEWLWRLFMEPKKRLKRIWNAVVVFPLTAIFLSD